MQPWSSYGRLVNLRLRTTQKSAERCTYDNAVSRCSADNHRTRTSPRMLTLVRAWSPSVSYSTHRRSRLDEPCTPATPAPTTTAPEPGPEVREVDGLAQMGVVLDLEQLLILTNNVGRGGGE